ncbi:MAG TPA: hypothetical protein VGE34_03530 [Candidatus Saccharimonadales bacterium]
MKCPQCGNDVAAGSYLVCAQCGYTEQIGSEEVKLREPKSSYDKWGVSLGVNIAALVCLVLGGGWTLLLLGPLQDEVAMLFWLIFTIPIYFILFAGLISLPITWPSSALFAYWFDKARQQNHALHWWQTATIFAWSTLSVTASVLLLFLYEKNIATGDAFLKNQFMSDRTMLQAFAITSGLIVPSLWLLALLRKKRDLPRPRSLVGSIFFVIFLNVMILVSYMIYADIATKNSYLSVPQLPSVIYSFDATKQLESPTVKKSDSSRYSTGLGEINYSQVQVTATFSDDASEKVGRILVFTEMAAMDRPACSDKGYLPDFMQSIRRHIGNNDPLVKCELAYKTSKGVNLYTSTAKFKAGEELFFRIGDVFFIATVSSLGEPGHGVNAGKRYPENEPLANGAYKELISKTIDSFHKTTLAAEEKAQNKKIAEEKRKEQELQKAKDSAITAVVFTPYGINGHDTNRTEKYKQYLTLTSATNKIQAGGWLVTFEVKSQNNSSSYYLSLSEVQQISQSSACVNGQLLLKLGACKISFTTPKGVRVFKDKGGGRYYYFVKNDIFFQMDASAVSSDIQLISEVIDKLHPI